MDFEAKKNELEEMQKALSSLDGRFHFEANNDNLRKQIDDLRSDISKLSGEVDILRRMDELDKKYETKEPIVFHYIDDDGLSDDIELNSGDINYDRAYYQQRELLQLEYNHYNKLPLSYRIRGNRGYLEGVINYDSDNYENVYNDKRNELLNINIITKKYESSDAEKNQEESKEIIKDKDELKIGNEAEIKNVDEVSKNPMIIDEKVVDSYIGQKGLKPNDLDSEYIVFLKDGIINVVGNFDRNWLHENYNLLNSDLIKNTDMSHAKLWNKLDFGNSILGTTGLSVTVAEDGSFTLNGEVEAIEYHNKSMLTFASDLEEKNNFSKVNEDEVDKIMQEIHNKINLDSTEPRQTEEDKMQKVDVTTKDATKTEDNEKDKDRLLKNLYGILDDTMKKYDFYNKLLSKNPTNEVLKQNIKKTQEAIDNIKQKINELENGMTTNEDEISSVDKDMSGLDIIPDDLSSGAEAIVPALPQGKKVQKRHLVPRLIDKFKGLKTWQKALIVAGVIAVSVAGVGVGVFVVGPQIINGISHLLNPESANVVNNSVGTVSDTVANTSTQAQTLAGLNYGNVGEGSTIFTNAYDAVNGANGAVANQWFNSNPVDVFNTATNSYMGLTPEQLADPNFMAELAKDPNNAVLFGNSVSDASGFAKLGEVVSEITKGGMVK